MRNNLGFRSWFYFRMGWSTYFVFIMAAINTLTVTYFLAIDNYPSLKEFFPSFEQYVVIIVCVGVPLLILVGYAHYKKTLAYKSEADVIVESNPYSRRNTVNGEINARVNLQLLSLLLKLSKNEVIDKNEIEKIEKLQADIFDLVKNRSFSNQMDLEFLKKEITKTSK